MGIRYLACACTPVLGVSAKADMHARTTCYNLLSRYFGLVVLFSSINQASFKPFREWAYKIESDRIKRVVGTIPHREKSNNECACDTVPMLTYSLAHWMWHWQEQIHRFWRDETAGGGGSRNLEMFEAQREYEVCICMCLNHAAASVTNKHKMYEILQRIDLLTCSSVGMYINIEADWCG